MRQSPLSRPPTDRLARSGSPYGHLISILLLLVITTTTTASATTTTGPQTDSYGTSSIYYYQQSPPPLLLLLVHPQSHMATSSTLLTCRHLQLIICGTVWVHGHYHGHAQADEQAWLSVAHHLIRTMDGYWTFLS